MFVLVAVGQDEATKVVRFNRLLAHWSGFSSRIPFLFFDLRLVIPFGCMHTFVLSLAFRRAG